MLSALAAISADPDPGAFISGVELGLSIAFILVAAFVGVSIFRRIIGG